MRRRPTRLVFALFLPVVALLGGCYLCPFGDFDLETQQFFSWKLNEAVPAKTWVPLGTYVLQQPLQIQNAVVS